VTQRRQLVALALFFALVLLVMCIGVLFLIQRLTLIDRWRIETLRIVLRTLQF